MAFASPHVVLQVRCASCKRAIELECEGVNGFLGYETYNEYVCPHCKKRNVARTAGAIVVARRPAA
jgi:predicted RNA-binding Zn-ribbon protein involved in translation (DUF1610 family)